MDYLCEFNLYNMQETHTHTSRPTDINNEKDSQTDERGRKYIYRKVWGVGGEEIPLFWASLPSPRLVFDKITQNMLQYVWIMNNRL